MDKKAGEKDGHEATNQQPSTQENKTTGNEPPPSAEHKEETEKPISKANEIMAKEVRDGKEVGIAELGAAAAALKQPVAIYDE